MHPLLKPFFNKGGIGVSLSRAESAERLRALADPYLDLLNRYDAAVAALGNRALAETLAAEQKKTRVEANKLYETLFSMGGHAPTGVEREPQVVPPGTSDAALLDGLRSAERALRDALKEDLRANHHIRTEAVLNVCLAGSERRLGLLR